MRTCTHTPEPGVHAPADADSIPDDFLGKWILRMFLWRGGSRSQRPLPPVYSNASVARFPGWETDKFKVVGLEMKQQMSSMQCQHHLFLYICLFYSCLDFLLRFYFFFPSLYIETNKLFLNHDFFKLIFLPPTEVNVCAFAVMEHKRERRSHRLWKVRSILIMIQMLI